LHVFIQRNTIARLANLTIDVAAARTIIEPVAVADVEPELGAISPNSVLHEPRENGRESRIEGPRINPLGGHSNNVGATAWPVAASAIDRTVAFGRHERMNNPWTSSVLTPLTILLS
jgi:hypothetical protein